MIFFVIFYYHIIPARFTLMYFKIPLIEGWPQDGVDEFARNMNSIIISFLWEYIAYFLIQKTPRDFPKRFFLLL